jgi:exosortase
MATIQTPVSAPLPRLRALQPSEWATVAAAALIVLAPLPWLTVHAQELARRPHYDLVWLVIPGALLIGWNALRQPVPPGSTTNRNPRRASMIAAVGLLLLTVAVVFISPWLATVATLLNILALIDAIGGLLLIKRLLPAWAFLWLSVPPPRGPDEKLLQALQTFATRWSSLVLDRLGVIHVVEGNVIELVNRKLFVEQACSGINSLFTLVLGTLFIAAWTRCRPIRAVVLVASAVVVVLAGNVIRIVLIAYMESRWHIDLSEGWPHQILGIVLYIGMLSLVFSTDRFLTLVGMMVNQEVAAVVAYRIKRWSWLVRQGKDAPIPRPKTPELLPRKPVEATEPLTLQSGLDGVRATLLGSWSFATVFALLIAAQVYFLWQNKRDFLRSEDSIVRAFEPLGEGDLPPEIGRFRRVEFRTHQRESTDLWGENSKAWTYRAGGLLAVVSLDYTFLGWHELTECYRSNGCGIGEPSILQDPDPLAASRSRTSHSGRTEVRLTTPEGRFQYLIYGLADYDNRVLDPPRARGFVDKILARVGNWTTRDNGLGIEVELPSYQFQVLLVSETPIGKSEIEEVRQLYQQVRLAFLSRGPKRHGGVS